MVYGVIGVALIATAFGVSAALTASVIGLARRFRALDIPNARSAHTVPTPRGGGIAIVATSLTAFFVLGVTGILDRNICGALTGGGALVAIVGAWDDLRSVSPLIRFSVHCSAGALALACLGGMPPLHYGLGVWHWGVLGDCVGVIGLVWLTNLTNFMDGIDGIAASQSAFCAGAASVLLAEEGLVGPALACAAIAASAIGFLVHNWPPARIFMGDVGSGFLGFVVGIMCLAHTRSNPSAIWTWLILSGLFTTDATVTVFRRIMRRQRFYEAHRDHGYQHAARRWGHLRVTSTGLAIDCLLVGPVAFLSARHPAIAPLLFSFVTAPLILFMFYLGAGSAVRERNTNFPSQCEIAPAPLNAQLVPRLSPGTGRTPKRLSTYQHSVEKRSG
jgi:Fuc2NAc and GlcNAc transferase